MESASPAAILISPQSPGSRLPPATAQRVSNLAPGPASKRFEEWIARLTRARSPLPVDAAGSGDAWNQIKTGFQSMQGLKDWWVASASAGLLHHKESCPHALASFDPDHPEAPARTSVAMQAWWESLGTLRAKSGYPNGVADLVRRFPEAAYLIILGSEALDALHADLWEAKEAAKDGNRFLILTSTHSSDPGLGASLLKVDALFEKMLGGPRATVTSRMARHIMTEFSPEEWRADFLQGWMRQMSWRLPRPESKPKATARRKIGSLELEIFVRRSLEENPKASPRSIHRQLLDSGRSCSESALAIFHQRFALPLLPV
ncbi:MAG: hypothetical protein ACKO2G_06475 [Verrucomicrobiales bacterium]